VALLIRGSKPDPRRVQTGAPDRQCQGRRGRTHSSLSSSPPARGRPTCHIQEPTRAASRGHPIEGELPRPRSLANETEPHLPNPLKRFHGRVSGPRVNRYRTGHGRPLESPDNSSTRNLQFATRSMGVAATHPPSRGGTIRERSKQVEELTLISSNKPRLGGSAHDYTSWDAPNVDDSGYVRATPPRPAGILPMPVETITPHAGKSCVKKPLQEHPRSCKASGARPAGPLARPHRIASATRGKNVPSASVNICGILTDTPTDARGLLSGTTLRVPQTTRGNPLKLVKNKRKRT
jgi:hypothetical protein